VTAYTDLVITGADVFTVDAARRWATGLAIRGDRIVAVAARDDELTELTGPSTQRLHLPGKIVVPGFQDAHVHPAFAGRNLLRVHLDEIGSRREALGAIGSYAREHAAEPWILGGGWAMALFPGGLPTAAELDTVVPDRPAFLMNRDVHTGWANSRALEAAAIDGTTPDPWDGRIERDSVTGDPTGALHEGAAYDVWERVVPATTATEWRRAILVAQQHLHALGITGWQDAWVRPELLRAYRDLDDAGDLTARVSAALWWDRHLGLEQIDGFAECRRWGGAGRVRAESVKIMIDGVAETCTCAMLEPYLDAGGLATGVRGTTYLDRDPLKEAVTALDAAGFQVHMHAIGDRAVRLALDAVAAARRANPPSDLRHHVAHLQFVSPPDVPRFRRLDVVANLQALWACHDAQVDALTIPQVGEERAARMYPFGELRRSGATLAMGSDWGVSSPNPMLQIEVAVTRTDPSDRDGRPLLPEQALDLPSALAAFTRGSAHVNHDDEAGSIEPGKRADLAILDRNPFDRDAGPIGEARVEMTIAAGRVVHDRT
jgi:predicted amidohydrolase YtcJ